MKLWIRVGMVVLAVATVAALALAAPATPVRADHVEYCENPQEYCEEITSGDPEDFFACGVFLAQNEGCYEQACPFIDGFVFFFVCDGDVQCYEETIEEPEFVEFKATFCASEGSCGDDRVNTNCSAPEIVYCNGDDADFYAYNYDTLEGDFDFSISLADLQQSVDEKTLVKQDGTVKVYLMPDGRVLLVARQPDGKDYFMYWNPNTCASLNEGAEWGVK